MKLLSTGCLGVVLLSSSPCISQGAGTVVLGTVRASRFAGTVTEGGDPLPEVTVDLVSCSEAGEAISARGVIASMKTDAHGRFAFEKKLHGDHYCLRFIDHVHWSNTTVLKVQRDKSAPELSVSMVPMT
jgi:hypothetical protein